MTRGNLPLFLVSAGVYLERDGKILILEVRRLPRADSFASSSRMAGCAASPRPIQAAVFSDAQKPRIPFRQERDQAREAVIRDKYKRR